MAASIPSLAGWLGMCWGNQVASVMGSAMGLGSFSPHPLSLSPLFSRRQAGQVGKQTDFFSSAGRECRLHAWKTLWEGSLWESREGWLGREGLEFVAPAL